MTLSSTFPALRTIFAAGFNQDWRDIWGDDPWDVVDEFLESTDTVTRVPQEVRSLLDTRDDAGLDAALDELTSNYIPSSEGESTRSFLEELLRRAEARRPIVAPEFRHLIGQEITSVGDVPDQWFATAAQTIRLHTGSSGNHGDLIGEAAPGEPAPWLRAAIGEYILHIEVVEARLRLITPRTRIVGRPGPLPTFDVVSAG